MRGQSGIYAFPHPLFIMPISPPLLFYYITICYITICVPTPRIHHAHITTITFPSFSRKRFSFWNVSALPQNHTLIISREYSWMFLTKWLHKLRVQSNLKVWATASKACWSPPTILDSSKQRHKGKDNGQGNKPESKNDIYVNIHPIFCPGGF